MNASENENTQRSGPRPHSNWPAVSLRVKIAVGIFIPTLAILMTITFWHLAKEARVLEDQLEANALSIGDITYFAIEQIMLDNHEEDIPDFLDRFKQLPEFEDVSRVRVISHRDLVLADTGDPGAVGSWMDRSVEAGCNECHGQGNGETAHSVRTPGQNDLVRVAVPIERKEACMECHTEQVDHLGVIILDVSFASLREHLAFDSHEDLQGALLSTALISIAAYFIVNVLIVRRIDALRTPISSFNFRGSPSKLLDPARVPDELYELGDTMQDMVLQLDDYIENEKNLVLLKEATIIEERERIARELHDGIAQLLTYIKAKIVATRLYLKNGRVGPAEENLVTLENTTSSLFLDVREAILGLQFSSDIDKGFPAVVENYVHKYSSLTGLPVHVDYCDDTSYAMLPPFTSLHVLRIIQEALANIRKHANASEIWLNLECENGKRWISIRDNGVGFSLDRLDPDDRLRNGLNNIRSRAEAIGAEFVLESAPGEGTLLTLHLKGD